MIEKPTRMNETKQIIFDLTPEQSTQLADNNECYLLEPLEIIEKDGSYIYDNYSSNDLEYIKSKIKENGKYKIDQQVQIRQDYETLEVDIGKQNSQFVKNRIIQQAIIKQIDIKRVQEINDLEIHRICGGWSAGQTAKEYFKDYFNKHFAEPRPIECPYCGPDGTAAGTEDQICHDCNGSTVKEYISYVYDKESGTDYFINKFNDAGMNPEILFPGMDKKLKDRELKIIVKPLCYIIKITKED